jgi:hypothetical protein
MAQMLLQSRFKMKVDRSFVSCFFMETGWQDKHEVLTNLIQDIQDDSKLLSGFPWPIISTSETINCLRNIKV